MAVHGIELLEVARLAQAGRLARLRDELSTTEVLDPPLAAHPTGPATWRPAPLPESARAPLTGGNLRRSATAAADTLGGTIAAPAVADALRRGGGRPLAGVDAQRFSAGFGVDLTGVRVHTDEAADSLTASVDAAAFTAGRDVYFSRGAFAPGTGTGDRLLAHELAHVVQGSAGSADASGSGMRIGRADDPAERAADRVADQVLARLARPGSAGSSSGRPAPLRGQAAPTLVARTLRRRISAISRTSADIEAVNGGRVGKKNFLTKVVTGSKDSLHRIGVLLDRQRTLDDPRAETLNLAALVTMCEHWLRRHQGDGDRDMAALVEDILAEARRDHGKALAQQRYLDDMELGGRDSQAPAPDKKAPARPTPLTQQIGTGVADRAAGLLQQARAGERPDAPQRQRALAELMRTAKLTQAEVAAVIAYTASDYLYINPATANSGTWLAAQQEAIRSAHTAKGRGTGHMDEQRMRQDGVTHAGMLMQALAKMPVMKGTVYRGARMNQKEFAEAYGRRTQIVYPAFTSSTTDPAVCNLYAKGGGERAPRPDQTVSVKCVFTVNNARDIRLLSDAGGEKEWLLMPGATFKVTKIEDDVEQVPGAIVPATEWKVVHLQQVDNGQQAPLRPARSAPASPMGPALSAGATRAVSRLANGDFIGPPASTPAGRAVQGLARRQF